MLSPSSAMMEEDVEPMESSRNVETNLDRNLARALLAEDLRWVT